ncbi:hypothetical protein [Kribbella sp. NPDC050459]|uniref:acyltransferase family protein n=1 Tax=Kribbella sp. NPDC050459 TaxID=3155785 RepID=UPI0033CD6321
MEPSRGRLPEIDLLRILAAVVLRSAWDHAPRSFVISRVVRLYPAYWIAVTLTAFVSIAFSHGRFPVSLPQYLANLTMFNTVAFQAGLLPHATDLVLNTQFSHYFIAGMALCLIHRYGASPQTLALVAVSLGNAIYRGIGFADRVGLRYHTEIHRLAVVGIIVAIFAVMLAVALQLTHRLGRPWFAVLGALTYPLYLVHAHIGFIIFEQLGDQVNHVLLVAATMALMTGVAAALHYGVERPLAPRLKRLLERGLPGRRPVHAARK